MKGKFIIFLIFLVKEIYQFLEPRIELCSVHVRELLRRRLCCFFSFTILNYVLRVLKMLFSGENDIQPVFNTLCDRICWNRQKIGRSTSHANRNM